jgi:ankyrin repeat protein
MVTKTPLLSLLDGILSQDVTQVQQAMSLINKIVSGPPIEESPIRSAETLAMVIQRLLQHRPKFATVASGHDGSLPLHFAASIGNVQVASLLFSCHPPAASTPNSKGKIPLHYAAREGRADMVVYLLQADPRTASIRSKKDKLSLHFASGEGHVHVVRALLQVHPQGASLTSKKGKMALHFAARWGHMGIAQDLFQICPQAIQVLDYEGSLPLHDAAREGQLEMARFLVDRYPQALSTANMRGEIPLFPAIRSGNVDLVVYLLKAWPMGGRQILRTVRQEDNVQDWDETILELCLRGAVENYTDCDLLQGASSRQKTLALPNSACDREKEQDHISFFSSPNDVSSSSPQVSTPLSALQITFPRSKSPVLEEGGPRKKRSSSLSMDDGIISKRLRNAAVDEEKASARQCQRPFIALHAALECGATSYVLRCVLERYADQVSQQDGLGQFPLHLGVANCREDASMVVLLDILVKCPQAVWKRDYLGRLPLHAALMNCANGRVIQNVLEANPCSGVQACGVRDARFRQKLPISMATEFDCELTTVYTLLRGDPSVINSLKN